MKTRILGMLGILFIGIVAFISACSSNNMPVTTTTYSNGTGGTGPSSTPIPTAVPTPKPVYYYSVYYTASYGYVGSTLTNVEYENPSGSMVYNNLSSSSFPFTSPTMTFKSGEGVDVLVSGAYAGTITVDIYVNGGLAATNTTYNTGSCEDSGTLN